MTAVPPFPMNRAILFIEDRPERLTRIRAVFEGAEEAVLHFAASLEAARELINQKNFDVVFISEGAVDRDRFGDLLETFTENIPHVALILIRERNDEEEIRRALRVGIDDCVSDEPCGPEAWLAAAERAVARRAGQRKTFPRLDTWFRERLCRMHELALTGMLVPGVVHDLNNLLTGTIAYTELLREKVTDAGLRTDLNKIWESAERCKKIADNLLAFSRQTEQGKSLELIHNLLDRAIQLLSYSFRKRNIELVKHYGEAPSLFVKVQDFQLAALNILVNAEQAIGEGGKGGGTITLTTGYNRDTRMISLRVADNGPGIPPHLLRKIFDPFFTTKSGDLGSGLGLTISRAIVADHGGTLRAENGEEGGAVFTIELPAKNDGGAVP